MKTANFLSQYLLNLNCRSAITGALQEKPVDAAAIGGSIAAVVIVIAVAAIVITYCCRQKTKHMEKAKEYEMRITGPGK